MCWKLGVMIFAVNLNVDLESAKLSFMPMFKPNPSLLAKCWCCIRSLGPTRSRRFQKKGQATSRLGAARLECPGVPGAPQSVYPRPAVCGGGSTELSSSLPSLSWLWCSQCMMCSVLTLVSRRSLSFWIHLTTNLISAFMQILHHYISGYAASLHQTWHAVILIANRSLYARFYGHLWGIEQTSSLFGEICYIFAGIYELLPVQRWEC